MIAQRRARGARRLQLVALSGIVLGAGCGDYDPEPGPGAGGSGQMSTTGQLGSAGQTTAGGSAGAEQTAMGGSSSMGGGGGAPASGVGGGSAAPPSVEASCSNVAPCGGDVAGSWVAAGSCLPVSGDVDMTGFGLGCTAAPVTGSLEVTGTWIANADGTFTDQTTTSGSTEIALPPSCLNVSGTTTACDRVDAALQALGFGTVTCVDAASGGCTCTASAAQTGGLGVVTLDPLQSGTYATADDVVTLTGQSSAQYAYCVADTTLTLTPQSAGRTGTVSGTIVLVQL